MITPPTAPSPGKPVSAGFFARLISWVKSGQLVEGVGYRLHRTPNGTRIEFAAGFGQKATPAALPWTFGCTADPETGERAGGWTNGRLQVGYDCGWGTPDVAADAAHTVADCDTCDDGYHHLVVDVNGGTAKIEVTESATPPSDYANGIVAFRLGRVDEGRLTFGTHVNPVCYTFV